MAHSLRTVIGSTDSGRAVYDIVPMDQRMASAASSRSFVTQTMAVFAFLTLLLSITGVAALVNSLVNRRMRELSIRAAVGASPASLRRQIIRWSLAVLVAGVGLGWLTFGLMQHFLVSLLFEVTPSDPLIAGFGGLLISLAVLGASAIPAFKAGRVDPITVLRHE
jgi:ABC-type antimicrobial peptide transport system permease subunit